MAFASPQSSITLKETTRWPRSFASLTRPHEPRLPFPEPLSRCRLHCFRTLTGVGGGGSARGFSISEPELNLFEFVALEISVLPLVVIFQPVPNARILPVSFNVTVPAIRLEDRDYVNRIRNSQERVALDDHQVIVIGVGGLEAAIVRSSHYDRIVAKRIEHYHLAVNVDHAGAEQLLFPVEEFVLDIVGYKHFVAQ